MKRTAVINVVGLSESLLGIHSSFYGAVVLLDNVVQVGAGSIPAPPSQPPFPLHFLDDLGIRRIAIDVDDAGPRMIRRGQELAEELLGSADIQSLADLGNSFGFVREMRTVPFSWQDVILLAVSTVLQLSLCC